MSRVEAAAGLVALTEEQEAIVAAVREFVDKEVVPVADELEHRDEFPEDVVRQMREMGLFGLTVPEEYGGAGLDLLTYALVGVELSRGWMSLSGIMNRFPSCAKTAPGTARIYHRALRCVLAEAALRGASRRADCLDLYRRRAETGGKLWRAQRTTEMARCCSRRRVCSPGR